MNFNQMKQATADAMDDPQVGDRFTELYAFWLYIVHRDGENVTIMTGNAPVTFPGDAAQITCTIDEIKERFGYGSGVDYWVLLVDRNNDVEGWYRQVETAN